MWACYKACVAEFFGDQLGWRGVLCMVACLVVGAISGALSGPGAIPVVIACVGVTIGGSVITGFLACIALCRK